MKNGLRIAAIAALALGVAACGKSTSTDNSANLSASDNMLVPADNSMTDMNTMGTDNSMGMDNSMTAGNTMMTDNSATMNAQ